MSDENDVIASDAPVPPDSSPVGPVALSVEIPVKLAPTTWYVTVPGCPLGRVCIKSETEAGAESIYRGIAGDECNPKAKAKVEKSK